MSTLFLATEGPGRKGRRLLVALIGCVLSLFLLYSCSNEEYEACLQAEGRGEYQYDKDQLCGCEKLKCDPGRKCFQGDCCDPLLEQENAERCGCAAKCKDGETCQDGKCCDSTSESASSRSNCGCKGPCDDRQDCQKDEAGHYQCVCDPELSLNDSKNCGCTDTVCDPDTDRCREGSCECDPLAGPNLKNDKQCGCRDACPADAYCEGGECHCKSADLVICHITGGAGGAGGSMDDAGSGDSYACVKQHDCACDIEKHMSDAADCACTGPCVAGDYCLNGKCKADPLAHANDDLNCGGTGMSCDIQQGEICQQGVCTCPPSRLSDNDYCACKGPCDVATGYICEQGTCTCPAARLSDNDNCGCKGPCDVAIGQVCQQGTCTCPAAGLSDNDNCGCKGPCDVATGHVCEQGSCQCPVARLSDDTNCACKGPCATAQGYACEQGSCQCPVARFSDDTNCACKGPCATAQGYACEQGTCVCPTSHLSDNDHCGCNPPMACNTAQGFVCSGGDCICSSAAQSDASHCGCGPACPSAPVGGALDLVCQSGTCQCPPSTNLCPTVANVTAAFDLKQVHNVCWPGGGGLPQICPGCFHFCIPGSHCASDTVGGLINDYHCESD